MAKYGIGARVKDRDGDEAEIIGKPSKGQRRVRYIGSDTCDAGVTLTWAKDELTPLPDNDNAVAEATAWVPKVGERVLVTNKSEPCYNEIGTIYAAARRATDLDVMFDTWRGGHDGDANDDSNNHWYLSNGDVEPVVASATTDERADAGGGFKAGDRLRLIDGALDIMPLGTEVVAAARTGGLATSAHYIDEAGHTTWRPGSYFELVKPLTIEAGKFYRTRDGRKVGPMTFRQTTSYGAPYSGDFVWTDNGSDNAGHTWQRDGHQFYTGDTDSNDLVAEWVEPLVDEVAVAPATAAPKFKAGDKVRALKSSWGEAYRKGEIYEVRAASVHRLSTVNDSHGSKTNGWGVDNFELVEPAAPPAKFKVGDRVVALVNYNGVRQGEVRAITGLSEVGVFLREEDGSPCAFFTFEEFAPATAPTIRVGAAVTFTATGRVSAINENGHVQITFPDLLPGQNSFALPAKYVALAN